MFLQETESLRNVPASELLVWIIISIIPYNPSEPVHDLRTPQLETHSSDKDKGWGTAVEIWKQNPLRIHTRYHSIKHVQQKENISKINKIFLINQ